MVKNNMKKHKSRYKDTEELVGSSGSCHSEEGGGEARRTCGKVVKQGLLLRTKWKNMGSINSSLRSI